MIGEFFDYIYTRTGRSRVVGAVFLASAAMGSLSAGSFARDGAWGWLMVPVSVAWAVFTYDLGCFHLLGCKSWFRKDEQR